MVGKSQVGGLSVGRAWDNKAGGDALRKGPNLMTRAQLLEAFADGRVPLERVLSDISGAAEEPRETPPACTLEDVERDPDGYPARTAQVRAYGLLCARKITEDDYQRIMAALL